MTLEDFFKFRKLKWQDYFHAYVTPRDYKKGARDIPFGMGAKSLYVDGPNGNDHNDGESWKTAFKTIQAAVDAAVNWTNVFIKSATYAENITISKHKISLLGERRDGVIINPSSGVAITSSGFENSFSALTLYSKTAHDYSLIITGDFSSCSKLKCSTSVAYGRGIDLAANYCDIKSLYVNNGSMGNAIRCVGDYIFNTISHSYIKLTKAASVFGIFLSSAQRYKIFENTFEDCLLAGVRAVSSSNNSIFHNNFIGTDPSDDGSADFYSENFYSSHSNTDNGFGIATSPFSIPSGSCVDSKPVIYRDGWNSISIQRALLRKKTGKQATQAATDANGTSWVDLKSISPTTSDLELHRIQMTVAGAWAGTAKYRIIVGSDKVYPFSADENISSGSLETFIFPINVQINETVKIQFRSTDAADGAGKTVALDQLDYSEVV